VFSWAEQAALALAVPEDPKQVRDWQEKSRPAFRRMAGLDLFPETPPSMKVLEKKRHEDLLVARLAVAAAGESGPWEATILEPAAGTGRRPGWVCVHGFIPGGKATVTGLIDSVPGAESWLTRMECDYGLQLARRGFVTLSFDCPGFGSRNQAGRLATPDPDMILGALFLGRTYLGWCIADAMAALSVLREWPTVDPQRVGLIGFSMGATIAAWTGALDRRVGAVIYSGRVASPRLRLLRDKKTSGPLACVPALMERMEYGDVMGLAAPTPMLVSQEVRNDPDVAARRVEPLIRAYRSLGASDKLTVRFDDRGIHKFMGPFAYEWAGQLWPA
jgi:dienelactone hydrolase